MARRKKRKNFTKQTEVNTHLNPQVREKKLGRERNDGQQWSGTGKIDIDPRQTPRRYLNTLNHELLHLFFIDLNEDTTTLIADRITDVLWKKGYRRIQL